MTEQEKLNLVTNYFAEDWAIDKAMHLLEDYEKEVEAQQSYPTPHADSQPKAQFDDPKVQAVYTILCDDADWPPKENPQQHWEGWIARRIVDALLADSVLEGVALWPAARDVLAERQRQINTEGWTPEHDDSHGDGEMAEAAACYAASAHVPAILKRRQAPGFWPWAAKWWKPSDTRRDLIKAGALILADLERLDRAARKQGASHD